MPTFKVNPGCQMPSVPVPVDITQLIADNKAKKLIEENAKKALAALLKPLSAIPGVGTVLMNAFLFGGNPIPGVTLQGVDAIAKTAAVQRVLKAISDAQALANRASKLTGALNNVSCPLPMVVDKEVKP